MREFGALFNKRKIRPGAIFALLVRKVFGKAIGEWKSPMLSVVGRAMRGGGDW